MVTKTYYIASDGEEFESEEECLAHEKTIDISTIPMLDADLVEILDKSEICYCDFVYLETQAKVMQFKLLIGGKEGHIPGITEPGLYCREYDDYGHDCGWKLIDTRIAEIEEDLNNLKKAKTKLLYMNNHKGGIR